MKILRLLAIPALTYLLTACSAHPGSGHWQNSGIQNPDYINEFSRIEVHYEGHADIFDNMVEPADTDEGNQAVRRCFWHGTDPQTIEMTCVKANNTDIEESYQLRVAEDRTKAELIMADKVVGIFTREQRPEIEHSYKEILQPQ
ncbi:MAG: hypothetical protein OQK13_04735 [Gammaproteobacteria bacterium]|nr:hypothetical protein [Gammaproteobacteria bacterium]